jgi:hypothetical protein
MAYNTTTDNLLNEIVQGVGKSNSISSDFPSWNGRGYYGSGSSYSGMDASTLSYYGAQKFAGLEEMVYIYVGSDYTLVTPYVSSADLNISVGGILQDISSAYLTACGGTTSYIIFRKIDIDVFYNPTSLKYTPYYKVCVDLWFS